MKHALYTFLVFGAFLLFSLAAHQACSPTTTQKVVQAVPRIATAAGAVCDVIVEFEDSDTMRSVCLTVESLAEYLSRPRTRALAAPKTCAVELLYSDSEGQHEACLSRADLIALSKEQDAVRLLDGRPVSAGE